MRELTKIVPKFNFTQAAGNVNFEYSLVKNCHSFCYRWISHNWIQITWKVTSLKQTKILTLVEIFIKNRIISRTFKSGIFTGILLSFVALWKASTYIYINENLKNNGQFSCEPINKCLLPRVARIEMASYNVKTFGERFQVLCLYFVKIVEKLIMVCSPCANSLDILLLVFQKHFVCKWRH